MQPCNHEPGRNPLALRLCMELKHFAASLFLSMCWSFYLFESIATKCFCFFEPHWHWWGVIVGSRAWRANCEAGWMELLRQAMWRWSHRLAHVQSEVRACNHATARCLSTCLQPMEVSSQISACLQEIIRTRKRCGWFVFLRLQQLEMTSSSAYSTDTKLLKVNSGPKTHWFLESCSLTCGKYRQAGWK